ncbi:nitroreductase family deazaflavin-dependent oxidoreductase [Kitasatospora sp. NPDC006697]|uniref:nitroreductase family deazaflavin-dependent oxidoreductase n=1 Tax=Kitasatospora sp. NPDC006697 TaxID=3364020 RepID=UPI003683F851
MTQQSATTTAAGKRYVRPKNLSDVIANRIVSCLSGLGISVWGSRVLAVRGRKSGEWRTTPVNVLSHRGARYLVAPRGHTQWVRNIRATPVAELRLGGRAEVFTAAELADTAKPEILRAYLRRWKFEVGMFFDGVDHTASDEELLRIAPGYPVFRIIEQ